MFRLPLILLATLAALHAFCISGITEYQDRDRHETTGTNRQDRSLLDDRCGMCCSFHEWINRQPRAFGIGFIPYQAAARRLAGPGLLPVAIHACRVLAANRHALSKVFFSGQ